MDDPFSRLEAMTVWYDILWASLFAGIGFLCGVFATVWFILFNDLRQTRKMFDIGQPYMSPNTYGQHTKMREELSEGEDF